MSKLFKFTSFIIVGIVSSAILFSCKSYFPFEGKETIEYNGKLLTPVLNPTTRPEFPGGSPAMFEFLRENLRLPQEAKKGKVRIAFIVSKEGELCDVRITSKPQKHLDDEVLRIMKIMPKWMPAVNEGEIVDSYYLLDIRLK